jgi:hypothetical protein
MSALLSFQFFEPIYHLDVEQQIPTLPEKAGCWLGVEHNVGDAMTYRVLTDVSQRVTQRTIVLPCNYRHETNKRSIDELNLEPELTLHGNKPNLAHHVPLRFMDTEVPLVYYHTCFRKKHPRGQQNASPREFVPNNPPRDQKKEKHPEIPPVRCPQPQTRRPTRLANTGTIGIHLGEMFLTVKGWDKILHPRKPLPDVSMIPFVQDMTSCSFTLRPENLELRDLHCLDSFNWNWNPQKEIKSTLNHRQVNWSPDKHSYHASTPLITTKGFRLWMNIFSGDKSWIAMESTHDANQTQFNQYDHATTVAKYPKWRWLQDTGEAISTTMKISLRNTQTALDLHTQTVANSGVKTSQQPLIRRHRTRKPHKRYSDRIITVLTFGATATVQTFSTGIDHNGLGTPLKPLPMLLIPSEQCFIAPRGMASQNMKKIRQMDHYATIELVDDEQHWIPMGVLRNSYPFPTCAFALGNKLSKQPDWKWIRDIEEDNTTFNKRIYKTRITVDPEYGKASLMKYGGQQAERSDMFCRRSIHDKEEQETIVNSFSMTGGLEKRGVVELD